ncbi:hypothetical protein [Sutcliffiella rhizosphaerae]|uniref:Uncharacterized protein n=1 Tax=Sutcliffiella rhizosphaerae TaxID=2880967 RepID=A0ABM8YQ20_9BACI|nr:hypothetical protein [Sutcliffiella rhizosphaerae]CAG9621873.1 hypothetical protein BACCIP111883_02664 [Sutcliffiella rhizosphaerae]
METFGRGCLYIIVGIGILLFLAIITQSHINVPWIIAIPLIFLAFYFAKKKSDEKNR